MREINSNFIKKLRHKVVYKVHLNYDKKPEIREKSYYRTIPRNYVIIIAKVSTRINANQLFEKLNEKFFETFLGYVDQDTISIGGKLKKEYMYIFSELSSNRLSNNFKIINAEIHSYSFIEDIIFQYLEVNNQIQSINHEIEHNFKERDITDYIKTMKNITILRDFYIELKGRRFLITI